MITIDRNHETCLSIPATGKEMYRLMEELYPICRSITGNGVRETLAIIAAHIPLKIHEVPTGTPVFDWVVPKEWNIADAYVSDANGNKVVDFQKSNLHVMNYSRPIRTTLPLSELKTHLFTLPDHPDWIPYRTSYYSENWGFCLSHKQFLELKEEQYEVVIDASLEDGHLTYGEYYLPGDTTDEVLISCHVCHPSLCNDNLSGIAVATGDADKARKEMALLWVLNLSDGRHSLLDIAERSGLEFQTVRASAELLSHSGLLKEIHSEQS